MAEGPIRLNNKTTPLLLLFILHEMHRDDHPAFLRQLVYIFIMIRCQIAGGQRIQPDIVEQQVSIGVNLFGKMIDVFFCTSFQQYWNKSLFINMQVNYIIDMSLPLFGFIATVMLRISVF